jgi:hypothetical protein
MTEEAHVSQLRKSAMDNGWHIRQGKGYKSRNRQDLLSHSMDVLQIVYNIQSELELETRFETKDYLSAAFFHDLHKVDEVGGTESMEEEEVEELLADWGIADEVLERFSTQEFTDVLRTVHQYHGGYDSGARVRMKSDSGLRLITHVVRLADGIASEEDLADLYTSGYRDNTEALEVINSYIPTEYVLGYHQLSEVKPALGALIHGSVRQTVREGGGIPIASRKDASIYLLPDNKQFDITEKSKQQAREKVWSSQIRSNVPSGTRGGILDILYGGKGSIDTIIETAQNKIQEERGEINRVKTDNKELAAKISGESEIDSSESEWELMSSKNKLLNINFDKKEVRTAEITSIGTIVGVALSDSVKEVSKKTDLTPIEIIRTLLDTEAPELSDYEDLNKQTAKSKLSRVYGNYYYQNHPDESSIFNDIQTNAHKLLEDKEEPALEHLDTYIDEVLSFNIDGTQSITPSFRKESSGLNYEEVCINCNRRGEYDFKTNQYGSYTKGYLARAEAGKATSDDWQPQLCSSCFIDQALMRSLSKRADISDIQDTLFFKVYPNRYLGTQQVRNLKQRLGEDFSGLREDAEHYFEQTNEIREVSGFEVDPFESGVSLYDSIDIGGMQALVSSQNYFLLSVEYEVSSGGAPAKQTTLTWLDAIQRSILFYRFYNLNVEIEDNSEINVEEPYPSESGVVLRSPPSHISTVFGGSIGFDEINAVLEGMTNMSYSLTLPQYDSDDNLNQIYSEFRRSLYPGSRMFREAEREWNSNMPIWKHEDYENIFSVCTAINTWKGRTMQEQTTNRIDEVVEAFQISARRDASPNMIQKPLRKLIDKILNKKNETKDEIINEAAASISMRMERKWDNPDIYFGEEVSQDEIREIIEEGCRNFYDKVYEDMLGGDKIRLADQKEDILDAFYFNVRKRGANQE